MAADSPTPATETCRWRPCWCPKPTVLCAFAPSPVDTTEPPAETQQDDERVTRGVARALWTQRLAHDPSVRERTAFLAGWDAALAARPSADTETLLPVRAEIIRQVREAAWHDGYEACRRGDQPHNPYRAALDAR